MNTKRTLEEDMSLKFVHLIYGILNKHTEKRKAFVYYHDTYVDGDCTVHMHKFKRKGIVLYKKLKELCDQLEQEGINGFQPTSAKTERYSGIVLYHKVKNNGR
jgi:hypothetical protein